MTIDLSILDGGPDLPGPNDSRARLSGAIDEMKAVAQRYNVGAVICLVTPWHQCRDAHFPPWGPIRLMSEAQGEPPDAPQTLAFIITAEERNDTLRYRLKLETGVILAQAFEEYGRELHEMFADMLRTVRDAVRDPEMEPEP